MTMLHTTKMSHYKKVHLQYFLIFVYTDLALHMAAQYGTKKQYGLSALVPSIVGILSFLCVSYRITHNTA